MKIEDGKGKNGDASVSSVQRLNVSSKNAPRIMYASRDFGLAYNAVYDGITAAANDYTAYLKNNSSTRNLFVDHVEFHSAENVKWKIWSVTGTAAAGESVTPSGMNLSKSIPAEAIAMAGNTSITGLTTVAQLGSHRSASFDESSMGWHGALILGPGDAIAIEYDAGTGGICSHDIFFWYEDLGAS